MRDEDLIVFIIMDNGNGAPTRVKFAESPDRNESLICSGLVVKTVALYESQVGILTCAPFFSFFQTSGSFFLINYSCGQYIGTLNAMS